MPRLRLPLLLCLLAAAMALSAAGAAARNPIALGVSIPDGRDVRDLNAATERYGRKPALWTIWSQWGHRGGYRDCYPAAAGSCAFPRATADELARRGITPVIWWEPVRPARLNDGYFPRYKNIISGVHDKYIRRWADEAKRFGQRWDRKIILRFAHEMNGRMFPWGVGRFDNSPRSFRRAWRHVWRIFEQQGALPYVDFLWSVAKRRCAGCNPYAKLYPGNRYVDYVGLSAYNWGSARQWRSLERVLGLPMRHLGRISPKPVILAEIGSSHRGGNRARWIRRGYAHVYARWKRIVGMMYLDTRQPAIADGHPDWSLRYVVDGGASIRAYRSMATDPRFRGNPRFR